MSPVSRSVELTLTLGGLLVGSLIAGVGTAAGQGLPGEPSEAEVDAALARHHEAVLDRGLAEGLTVWFIVNAEGTVLETGVDETNGLEERLRSRFPDITSEFVIDLLFMTINGRRIPILWMLSEPPVYRLGGQCGSAVRPLSCRLTALGILLARTTG